MDPFCGTGVVLQEALLMGYEAYGTDLEPRMIDYTKANLTWLQQTYALSPMPYTLETADATTYQWKSLNNQSSTTNVVIACETYLGRPFTERPTSAILSQTITEVNLILKRFLQNIKPQLLPGTRLCLALPCWFDGREQKHLPLLAHLSDMGLSAPGSNTQQTKTSFITARGR
ncbi:hypothetical protein IPL68_04900 [Candidatus Saccharibacteria bacterium]|nr:MAG: hypothetical protein IPL68_04900 [Candidatus Saccharibacteria bacterium]